VDAWRSILNILNDGEFLKKHRYDPSVAVELVNPANPYTTTARSIALSTVMKRLRRRRRRRQSIDACTFLICQSIVVAAWLEHGGGGGRRKCSRCRGRRVAGVRRLAALTPFADSNRLILSPGHLSYVFPFFSSPTPSDTPSAAVGVPDAMRALTETPVGFCSNLCESIGARLRLIHSCARPDRLSVKPKLPV
jgi:hypothetical protein